MSELKLQANRFKTMIVCRSGRSGPQGHTMREVHTITTEPKVWPCALAACRYAYRVHHGHRVHRGHRAAPALASAQTQVDNSKKRPCRVSAIVVDRCIHPDVGNGPSCSPGFVNGWIT